MKHGGLNFRERMNVYVGATLPTIIPSVEIYFNVFNGNPSEDSIGTTFVKGVASLATSLPIGLAFFVPGTALGAASAFALKYDRLEKEREEMREERLSELEE